MRAGLNGSESACKSWNVSFPTLSAETPHLLNLHGLQQSSFSSILDGDDAGGGDDDDDDDLLRPVVIWQKNKF